MDLLKTDPAFVDEYPAPALDEVDQPGGRAALLAALRHIAEAQGMSAVAERAGMPRKPCTGRCLPRASQPSRRCWPCWAPPVCA